jgi:heme/copper-type cytochrome/quinol oxidase subunit 2
LQVEIDIYSWVVIGLIALINLGIVIAATRMKISYEIKRGILGTRVIELLWTVLPFGLTVAIIWISFRV